MLPALAVRTISTLGRFGFVEHDDGGITVFAVRLQRLDRRQVGRQLGLLAGQALQRRLQPLHLGRR